MMRSRLCTFKTMSVLAIFLLSSVMLTAQKPIAKTDLVFAEKNGIVAVEAEHFYKQSKTDKRQWYIQPSKSANAIQPDSDPIHTDGASGNAYIEILPDTRVTAADKLIEGDNFSGTPGAVAVVHYKVHIEKPGRYYVWARVYSAGAEDNGLHVGFDDTWPEHGMRMQWCEGKNQWTWASAQRTEKAHCGEKKEIYLDIEKPGLHDIQFSMREDGFEMDKFILTTDSNYVPKESGPASVVFSGEIPEPFKAGNTVKSVLYFDKLVNTLPDNKALKATDFKIDGTNYYNDNGKWLAINPAKYKEASAEMVFPYESGTYDLIFAGVGENDGQSSYVVTVNGKEVGHYTVALSKTTFEEGVEYLDLWESINIKKGDKISVTAKIGSADGKEFSRGRWSGIVVASMTQGKDVLEHAKNLADAPAAVQPEKQAVEMVQSKDGNGTVQISGELKQWHKVTLTLAGPRADEADMRPNPFTDYNMMVKFTHESGSPSYSVPGYFAADGNAGETGASAGNKWRAHLSPDKTGVWHYEISFKKGTLCAVAEMPWSILVEPFNGASGSFTVAATDKTGRDFRAAGRLEYVGKHHLQFKGTGEYFFKAGTDAPETLLAYEDFDNTIALKPNVPLKKFEPHLADYKAGDPTWKNGKGKGMIGAINYLASKGINSISFLTYNAGGDGDNVWPFTSRDAKLHYDCSKLDQWGVVFDYAQAKGLYLHFKTQENENDDNVKGKGINFIPEALDGGDLGPERRLYYRELIARYGYQLALNWNLGEENTQTAEQEKAMADFFAKNDPYKHNIVLHTFPGEQDKYTALIGEKSALTGVSLQNEWDVVHAKTLKWVTESDKAGKPWVVANDEQGSAGKGVPADPGYKGYDAGKVGYSIEDVRKQTLWGNLMAGGAGVEYYFGYQLPENDLICEDFRSRDKSWDYCAIAINFLKQNKIPFYDMVSADALLGKTEKAEDKFCLAKSGEMYMVYLAYVPTSTLDLTGIDGTYAIKWFNPAKGGKLQNGSVKTVKGGNIVALGNAPTKTPQDWVVIVARK